MAINFDGDRIMTARAALISRKDATRHPNDFWTSAQRMAPSQPATSQFAVADAVL